jgi:hypothetical protein
VIPNDRLPRIVRWRKGRRNGNEFGAVDHRPAADGEEQIRFELVDHCRDLKQPVGLGVRRNPTFPANFSLKVIERRVGIRPRAILVDAAGAEGAENLGVGLHKPAQVIANSILVEGNLRYVVPESLHTSEVEQLLVRS